MDKRVLVTSAGTGASNNLIRSLRAGDPELGIVGCHSDRFVLKKSPAHVNYLVPPITHPDLPAALARIVEREQIDLVIPDTDADVRAISALRHALPCRTFLPGSDVVDRCQDKYALTIFLRERGIPAPRTEPVTDLDGLEAVLDRLGPQPRFWCRMRSGYSSSGAIPVIRPEQARSWIRYWEEMRGVPATTFTVSEYLPGRDFSLQCLWKTGSLVLVKMSERLAYFVTGNNPSGVSSTPALAKTVREPRVIELCTRAIHALDPQASGVFCFDVKEDATGVPCITEINAGRFAMITNIYDLAGKHNMALTYVRLALDEPVDVHEPCDLAEDYYLVRDLDTIPGIFHADELFDGIQEWTAPS